MVISRPIGCKLLSFARSMLTWDPDERMTAKALLHHPILQRDEDNVQSNEREGKATAEGSLRHQHLSLQPEAEDAERQRPQDAGRGTA